MLHNMDSTIRTTALVVGQTLVRDFDFFGDGAAPTLSGADVAD